MATQRNALTVELRSLVLHSKVGKVVIMNSEVGKIDMTLANGLSSGSGSHLELALPTLR